MTHRYSWFIRFRSATIASASSHPYSAVKHVPIWLVPYLSQHWSASRCLVAADLAQPVSSRAQRRSRRIAQDGQTRCLGQSGHPEISPHPFGNPSVNHG